MLSVLDRRLKGAAAVALVAAVCVVGCSENSVLSAPSTSTVGEAFSGTVPVGGSDSHPFKTASGQVSVLLTAAGPPDAITMGIGIGLWDGSTSRRDYDGVGRANRAVLRGREPGDVLRPGVRRREGDSADSIQRQRRPSVNQGTVTTACSAGYSDSAQALQAELLTCSSKSHVE
jgi:hypothetical protein